MDQRLCLPGVESLKVGRVEALCERLKFRERHVMDRDASRVFIWRQVEVVPVSILAIVELDLLRNGPGKVNVATLDKPAPNALPKQLYDNIRIKQEQAELLRHPWPPAQYTPSLPAY